MFVFVIVVVITVVVGVVIVVVIKNAPYMLQYRRKNPLFTKPAPARHCSVFSCIIMIIIILKNVVHFRYNAL